MLTAYVPGVAIYRAIETGSCRDDMTQLDCHSQPICWRHDLDRYRYTTHGLTAAFLALAAILFVAALCLSPGSDAPDAVELDSPVANRRTTGVRRGSGAPVSRDVRPRVADVNADVTSFTAGSPPERNYGSVSDTPM